MGNITVHGIILSEAELEGYGDDSITVRNTDISHLVGGTIYWWVGDGSGERIGGVVTAAKAIQGLQDCASDADRGLWDLGQGKPVIRATATLVDPEGHWLAGIKSRVLGWSAAGAILRRDPAAHCLLKTVYLDLHHGRRPYPICRPILGQG